MHNHPSGDATPSEADIKVTRNLIRAGQIMKIEVLDHVVIGNPNRSSLRELGLFRGAKRDPCPCVRWFLDFPGDGIACSAFGEEKIERRQYVLVSGYAGRVCFTVFNVVAGAAVSHQFVLPCDDPSRRALYPIRVLISLLI